MATTAIVINLIAKVHDLCSQETVLFDEDDVRHKLLRICDYLNSFEFILEEIERGQEHREVTSELLAEVKEIAFTVEDLFDTFIVRKKQQKKQNIMVRYTFSIFENLAYRRKFFDEFHVVESRMTGTLRTRLDLAWNNIDKRKDTSTDFMDVRRSTPTFGKDDIIGLEGDLQLLKHLLVMDDPEIFIPIVGMGGIGKTTLAKALYNNNDVIKHFDIRAWIYVSQESNWHDLINNICISLTNSAQSYKTMEERAIKLRNFCKEKRYLLVLDDVWMADYDKWDTLKRILPAMGNGSRVLLTTRNREIAFATTGSHIHDMKFLTAENSWMLLLEIVGRMETDPPELIELGKKIVNKCGGLPLAIQVVGGLLSRKRRTVSDWSMLLNIDSWHLNETQNSFSSILELSFKDLPLFVMPLFLYLLVFPKDYEIPLRRLYGLWLAEGFLKSRTGSTDRAEDLAHRYLRELAYRQMIQFVRWKLDGAPKTIRVAGLLRDTLLSRASDIGFFHNQNSNSGAAQPTSAIRRLVEYTDIHDYSSLERIIQKSRSYISFNFQKGDIPAELTGRFLAGVIQKRSFRLLGILDLERVYKPKLPDSIGKLLLLKYLGLRWTFIDALPSSVGDLLNLEILDVKHTYISRLPSSIRKTKKLQHLYLNEIHLDLSVCGVALRNIQTLWGLSADMENPIKNYLDCLITLTKLGLTVQDTLVEVYAEWISRLTALETLRFRSRDGYGRPSDLKLGSFTNLSHLYDLYLLGRLTSPLHALQLPESLTVLTLSVSGLEKDPMPTLERLPKLHALRLFANSFTGKRMVCSNRRFCSLRILKLWMLEELEEWIIEEGAMSFLTQLEIRCCKKLKKCPKNMLQLFYLKDLILTNMSEDFVEEVEAGKGVNVSLPSNNWEFLTSPSQDQESSLGGEGSG